ncbi:ATP-binding cassette domain-containing protein [Streptomyces sp. NPDC017890]|uniref:ATP-binding cassette domain-containing protein n=1 Tax=Streptomyces sp. NPDC017890 TaxID=3365015 RepID=UPI0037A1F5E4
MTASKPSTALRAEGLVKNFGSFRALDGVDLELPTGQVLGLLGPNGAGKTTTVRCLSTLLRPDGGRAWVNGHDVLKNPHEVRRSIGLSGQFAAVDESLTGYENVVMFARLGGLSKSAAIDRATSLIDRFGLKEAAGRPPKTYSGGMRRRLDLASALVGDPAVMVLDEPTTGLDPRGRLDTWDQVGELVGDGTSVLLTTQYLEEADQLADSVAVIDHGRVIAHDTADRLKAQIGADKIRAVAATAGGVAALTEVLAGIGTAVPVVEELARTVSVTVSTGVKALGAAIRQLEDRDVELVDIGLQRPTLDDVFLSLTGRPEPAESGSAETQDRVPEKVS